MRIGAGKPYLNIWGLNIVYTCHTFILFQFYLIKFRSSHRNNFWKYLFFSSRSTFFWNVPDWFSRKVYLFVEQITFFQGTSFPFVEQIKYRTDTDFPGALFYGLPNRYSFCPGVLFLLPNRYQFSRKSLLNIIEQIGNFQGRYPSEQIFRNRSRWLIS